MCDKQGKKTLWATAVHSQYNSSTDAPSTWELTLLFFFARGITAGTSRPRSISDLFTADTASIRRISPYFEVQYCRYYRTLRILRLDTVGTPWTSRLPGFCSVGAASTGSILSCK